MTASWRKITLGDVLVKTETVNPLLKPSQGFEYIDVSSVSNQTFTIENTQTLKGKDAPSRARKLVKTNDVLFATVRPTLKRIAMVPESLNGQVCSTGYFVLRPVSDVHHRFIFYYLQTPEFMGQMETLQKGASYPAVTDAQVREQEIPLPPLPEQKRIVGILDETFEGIAKARANAEKNLANARELFESYLRSEFEGPDSSRIVKPLSDICEILSVLVDPRERKYLDLPHVGGANIESETGKILELKTAREEGLISGKFLFDESMVLYSKIRPYLKKVARPDFGGLCSADIYPLSPKKGQLERDYLFYMLLSPIFTEYAISGSDRAGMPKVNRDHLFAYEVALPSIERQRKAATVLNTVSSEATKLEDIYRTKTEKFNELKATLLDQAFAGRL